MRRGSPEAYSSAPTPEEDREKLKRMEARWAKENEARRRGEVPSDSKPKSYHREGTTLEELDKKMKQI